MPTATRFDNLPAASSELLGRDTELAAATVALRAPEARLLTLTGPGGSGKTRLAVELARQLAPRFGDGVAFVDLAAIHDPALVFSRIVQVLGQPQARIGTPLARAIRSLQPYEMLLVLDNFEQILPAAEDVGALLAACPLVKVVVTSRESLKLPGERVFPVMPLDLPDERSVGELDHLAGSPAIQLFVDRARELQPELRLDDTTGPAVAGICMQLDGLPLAIELAAARAGALTPSQILSRLQRPRELLALGREDLPSRQRSLRRAIGWSYELLTPAERRLAERLAVFVGGWTLDAAEAVCGDAADAAPVPVALLSLVDKNLIRRQDGRPTRYAILCTIREFLLERLEAGTDGESIGRAHADYFCRLTERAAPELFGANQRFWLDRLDQELENIRAAIGWALAHREADLGLRLAGGLWKFWEIHGHLAEGRRRIASVLDLPGGSPPARAHALQGVAHLAFLLGDFDSARRYGEAAVDLLRELDDAIGLALALNGLGLVATFVGDLPGAWALFRQAEAANRAVGERAGQAMNLNNLGRVAFYRGDHQAARDLQHQSAELRRDLGDHWGLSLTMSDLADVELAQGEVDESERLLIESFGLWVDLGSQWGVAYVLEGLAGVAAHRLQYDRAIELIATAASLRHALDEPANPFRQRHLAELLDAARKRLASDAYDAAWRAGRAATFEEAIARVRG